MAAIARNDSYYLFSESIASIPPAVASAVACTTALFALVYFKMYRHFTYRLVLYTLFMTTLSNLFLIAIMAMVIRSYEQSGTRPADALYEIVLYAANGIFISMWVITSCISFSIYNMVVHNHLFKSWVSDLTCFLLSVVSPIAILSLLTVACDSDDEQLTSSLGCVDRPPFRSPLVILVTAMLFVAISGVFLGTSVVFVCCRASDCNTITWTAATTASHRQALKETVSLLLIPAATLIYIVFESCGIFMFHTYSSTPYVVQIVYFVDNFIPGALGLGISLLFTTHLCLLGKGKLKKLRGVKKRQVVQYGTMENQLHTHRPTVFTTEGVSETCNTDYPHVSEDEVDRQFFQLPKASAV